MFEAIILGIVQGLTEFLPISSSAHIRILGAFMSHAKDPGATFTAITQIGTELAVLIYFRKDIINIVKDWTTSLFSKRFRKFATREEKSAAKLGWMVILGSVPIVIVGFLFQDTIRTTFRSLWLIGSVLIVFGLILAFADRVGRSERTLKSLSPTHGILYGIAQTLALVPGVSRSGATIAMGRFLGYERKEALRYSFLLAIPAVLGSGLFELRKAIKDTAAIKVFTLTQTAVATTIAFVVGYFVIAWLMKFISTKSFMPFVIYRVILGSGLLILLATGAIK